MKLETITQKEALQIMASGGRVYTLSPISEDSSIKDLFGVESFAVLQTKKETKKEPEADSKAEPKAKTGRKPKCDIGKMVALYNAGWPIAKIADELGVSDQTIRNYIAKYTKKKTPAGAESADKQET